MMVLPRFLVVQDELPRSSRRATAELSWLYPGTRRRKSRGPGISSPLGLKSCNEQKPVVDFVGAQEWKLISEGFALPDQGAK